MKYKVIYKVTETREDCVNADSEEEARQLITEWGNENYDHLSEEFELVNCYLIEKINNNKYQCNIE